MPIAGFIQTNNKGPIDVNGAVLAGHCGSGLAHAQLLHPTESKEGSVPNYRIAAT